MVPHCIEEADITEISDAGRLLENFARHRGNMFTKNKLDISYLIVFSSVENFNVSQ